MPGTKPQIVKSTAAVKFLAGSGRLRSEWHSLEPIRQLPLAVLVQKRTSSIVKKGHLLLAGNFFPVLELREFPLGDLIAESLLRGVTLAPIALLVALA